MREIGRTKVIGQRDATVTGRKGGLPRQPCQKMKRLEVPPPFPPTIVFSFSSFFSPVLRECAENISPELPAADARQVDEGAAVGLAAAGGG